MANETPVNLRYNGEQFILQLDEVDQDSPESFILDIYNRAPGTSFKKSGMIHCRGGRFRSLRDVYHLITQYFDITQEQFLKIVANLCAQNKVMIQYCVNINQLVFSHFHALYGSGYYKIKDNIGGSGKQAEYLRSLIER